MNEVTVCQDGSNAASGSYCRLFLIEFGFACAATGFLVMIHLFYLFHAGGLWRDEVNTVNVATRASLLDLWTYLRWDSCPIFWPLVLRYWVAFWGTSDLVLRCLGLLVGVLLLISLWFNAWLSARSLPFCSLALFAVNPSVLRFADSLRAFGFGTFLIILTLPLVYRLVQRQTTKGFWLTTAIAVCAVQCLYHNAVLLFVLCISGAVIRLRARSWGCALKPIAVGFICAMSMVIYKERILGANQWSDTLQVPLTLPYLFSKFTQAVNLSSTYFIWPWVVTFGVALLLATWQQTSNHCLRAQKDLALYFSLAAVGGVVVYLLFLRALGYVTQPWYYIPVMALIASCVDVTVESTIRGHSTWRFVRLGVFLLLFVVAAPNILSTSQVRQTNIDLIAGKLGSTCQKDDLVVVTPWYLGITFNRYYHGSAEWMTLPIIEDHLTDRRDLIKRRIQEANPIQPVLDRMSATLRNGHKLWLVDSTWYISAFARGATLRTPELPSGPLEWPYVNYWMYQTAVHLQSVSVQIREIPLGLVDPVSPYETATLYAVESQFKNLPNVSNLSPPNYVIHSHANLGSPLKTAAVRRRARNRPARAAEETHFQNNCCRSSKMY